MVARDIGFTLRIKFRLYRATVSQRGSIAIGNLGQDRYRRPRRPDPTRFNSFVRQGKIYGHAMCFCPPQSTSSSESGIRTRVAWFLRVNFLLSWNQTTLVGCNSWWCAWTNDQNSNQLKVFPCHANERWSNFSTCRGEDLFIPLNYSSFSFIPGYCAVSSLDEYTLFMLVTEFHEELSIDDSLLI